jgi:two-component sensor histidine kinase
MNTRRMSNGHYQAIMRNITERKRAENMLLEYQEELESLVKRRTHQLEKAISDLKKENSERLHTEELLKFQLKEKVILLKEIHHRVKNNMQVIISLLNLQAANIDDHKMLELYQESQNRIKSMALIHEKLYQSKDLTHIDFSEYVNSLTNYLAHGFLTEDHKIEIKTKSQNIPLEYDIVIALGLIINELVSNSMKYAFKGCKKGKVEISLRKIRGNFLQLCVADNGKGIPKQINFRNTKSLGLQLVCSLTEQIGGSISMTNTAGTKFCIQFPYTKK